ENTKVAMASLKQNAAILGSERLELLSRDALQFIAATQERFDVIFLDPPYRAKLLPQIFPLLPDRLKPEGVVYFESDQAAEPPPGWRFLKESRAGVVHFQIASWGEGK
ncbi:MAG TPA: RsmD family RNA methyltransferase, partial [Burkholderiales bacterium]|nr:RsmD family RNA methyltransferase [Burkholderiales bacterium]